MTIESVKLSNWKCHEDLDVRFEPGLNFVLGENGSGKSSLLQAIEFSLSGRTSSAARNFVHMRATHGASVRVTLDIGGTRATIARAIDERGETHELLHTEDSDAEKVSDYVANAFGTAATDLTRLLFFSEGDIYETDAGDTGVSRHLERLLPLQSLASLAEAVRGKRKSLERQLKTRRGDLKVSKEEQASLAARRSELDSELSDAEEAERALVARERELATAVHQAEVDRRVREEYSAWAESLSRLVAESGADSGEPEAVLRYVERDREDQEARVRSLLSQQGRLEGECTALESTIESLEAVSGDECPLCHQPLTREHRERLLDDNRRRVDDLKARLEAASLQLNESESVLDRKSRFVDELRAALAQRPEVPAEASTVRGDVADELSQVQAELQGVRDRTRTAFEELANIRERLATAEADRRIESEVVTAFRNSALLDAASQAVESFVAEVNTQSIGPLSDEVSRQWKGYRPQAPWSLVIDDNGLLAITMQGEQRPYSALSAGEKTVATVLLRLALAIAFTSSDFVVLDEPLEHLDPRSRRVLVSSLSQAVEQELVKQVIVSTYEEALVRRLQHDDRAHTVYLA